MIWKVVISLVVRGGKSSKSLAAWLVNVINWSASRLWSRNIPPYSWQYLYVSRSWSLTFVIMHYISIKLLSHTTIMSVLANSSLYQVSNSLSNLMDYTHINVKMCNWYIEYSPLGILNRTQNSDGRKMPGQWLSPYFRAVCSVQHEAQRRSSWKIKYCENNYFFLDKVVFW